MKQIVWLLTALLTLASCGRKAEKQPQVTRVNIDTVTLTAPLIQLQYPGKVKAAQDISMAFRVSGTIARFAVDEGAPVRQGQLLAELDPTDYQVQLDATEAEYLQVKAEAERVMALYADSATTASNYDKALYGLKQITAKYEHHRDQLEYTRLYAPFNGFVQKRLFKAHETVGAGMPVLSLVSGGAPEVEINLPAAEYINRANFSSYHCTFQLYPGTVYPLRLISISPKANANQLYTMRLLIDTEGRPSPSPGMNTMVSILSGNDGAQAVSVPSTALFQADGHSCLYRYTPADGQIHRLEVEPVRPLSNGRILIHSTALQAGDIVVTSGVHHLTDEQQVVPLPSPSATNVGGLL